LELYAFVRPARGLVPTPRGLAAALSLSAPCSLEDDALALVRASEALLAELAATGDSEAKAVAQQMAAAGWLWGAAAMAALAQVQIEEPAGLAAWRRLGEWSEYAPEPPAGHEPVEEAETRRRLAELLGSDSEPRPQQADYAGWLPDLLGRGRTLGLADRRGECIHSACPHYHKCFIEKSVRRARRARLVVANHALVMVQAAWGGLDDSNVPTRYVFDEGH